MDEVEKAQLTWEEEYAVLRRQLLARVIRSSYTCQKCDEAAMQVVVIGDTVESYCLEHQMVVEL